jgi:hypothetical protein
MLLNYYNDLVLTPCSLVITNVLEETSSSIFAVGESNYQSRRRYIKQEVLGRTNRLRSLIDTGHTENDASNNSSIVACVLVTTVTCLPSRCLATIGGFYRAVA